MSRTEPPTDTKIDKCHCCGTWDRVPDSIFCDSCAHIRVELSYDEMCTVVAALCLYRDEGYGDTDTRPGWLHEIACPDGGNMTSLCDESIDELCERMRPGGRPPDGTRGWNTDMEEYDKAVDAVAKHPDKFGPGTVDMLAAALDLDPHVLARMLRADGRTRHLMGDDA